MSPGEIERRWNKLSNKDKRRMLSRLLIRFCLRAPSENEGKVRFEIRDAIEHLYNQIPA